LVSTPNAISLRVEEAPKPVPVVSAMGTIGADARRWVKKSLAQSLNW
jgi:hypothetical protein